MAGKVFLVVILILGFSFVSFLYGMDYNYSLMEGRITEIKKELEKTEKKIEDIKKNLPEICRGLLEGQGEGEIIIKKEERIKI
jgi:hypothetical protein